MKKYYDPEYDREVTEVEVNRQYNWFINHGMKKSFEQFEIENFTLLREFKIIDLENKDIIAHGYAQNSSEFYSKEYKKITEYDKACEGDWIIAIVERINGKWTIIE